MNDKSLPEGEIMIEFERTRINLWHIFAIATGIAINSFAVGGVYFAMKANDAANTKAIEEVHKAQNLEVQARVERGKLTDAKFQNIFDKLPQFELINQQILRLTEIQGQTMKAIEEANNRIDRVTESTAGKLDTIIARQAEQSADIKVIQSQLTDQKRVDRTRFPTLRKY